MWGIGQEEFERLLSAQQGGCAIRQVPLDAVPTAPPTASGEPTPDGKVWVFLCTDVAPACEGSGGMWNGCDGALNTWANSSADLHRGNLLSGRRGSLPGPDIIMLRCGLMGGDRPVH